jgi:hypothetical protein
VTPIFSSMGRRSSLLFVVVVGNDRVWRSGLYRRDSWEKRSGERSGSAPGRVV